MMDHDTLRRAAVLVASLKPGQADELVAQLSSHDAKRLQARVANLSAEDLAASADVIEDFLDHHQEPAKTPSMETLATAKTEELSSIASEFNVAPDFDFLDQVSPALVADFLSSVHSQIGAAILSALPSRLAGVILSYFDSQKQQDVLDRIAVSGTCAAESLQFAVLLLQDRLLQIDTNGQGHSPRPDTKAQEIRAAAQSSFRNRTISTLDTPGTELGHLGAGQRLERSTIEAATQPITLRFEDLILLDDRSLAQVFHVVDSQIMLLALAGATVEFIKRVSGPLTSSQKERFNEQIKSLGPITLNEIEQAQQNVAETATHLANAGQITITGQQPFLAAA
ncbi:MAG: FliG C-terminal domain-containing protein [Planctomycetota bacterium]|nr:FliG C-terminal domain-containing protein [Planctomycetota bacterium]